MRQRIQKKEGFTILEVLVVVAIIGLISSISLTSLNSVRSKARDTRRKVDMANMRKAIEMYEIDNNHYPIIPARWACSALTDAGSCSNANWLSLASMLSPYMSTLPADPLNANASDPINDGNHTYGYYSDATGSAYDLITNLEVKDDPARCGIEPKVANVLTAQNGSRHIWCTFDPICGPDLFGGPFGPLGSTKPIPFFIKEARAESCSTFVPLGSTLVDPPGSIYLFSDH